MLQSKEQNALFHMHAMEEGIDSRRHLERVVNVSEVVEIHNAVLCLLAAGCCRRAIGSAVCSFTVSASGWSRLAQVEMICLR